MIHDGNTILLSKPPHGLHPNFVVGPSSGVVGNGLFHTSTFYTFKNHKNIEVIPLPLQLKRQLRMLAFQFEAEDHLKTLGIIGLARHICDIAELELAKQHQHKMQIPCFQRLFETHFPWTPALGSF